MTIKNINRIFKIFKASQGEIRPHHIITGASGSGKTYTVQQLCELNELEYFEINAAQLTKEGTAGNSLSKALSPLQQKQGVLTVCLVDEFDKLFISGNNNSSLAHETTNGVQNEFLKVLESDLASVYGDYGKYINVPVKNVLFVFAGAFNGEADITIDKLRDFGVKTEFLGRVGLVFNLHKLTLEELIKILTNSKLLHDYLNLFQNLVKEDVITDISQYLSKNYDNNTLGARIITTLLHQYFINGGKLETEEVNKVTFQTKLDPEDF